MEDNSYLINTDGNHEKKKDKKTNIISPSVSRVLSLSVGGNKSLRSLLSRGNFLIKL